MKRLVICALVLLLGVVGVWGQEATPEITPEATALPLIETYTSEEGSLTFQYPEEWILNPPVFLGNSYSVRLVLNENPESRILFYVGNEDGVASQAAITHAASNNEPIALASIDVMRQAYLEGENTDSDITGIGEVVQTVINDHYAAYLIVEFENNVAVLILTVEMDDDNLIHLLFRAPKSEFEAWQHEVFAIAESIAYNPTPEATALPLTETYTSEEKMVTFMYPRGWFISDNPARDEIRVWSKNPEHGEIYYVPGGIVLGIEIVEANHLIPDVQFESNATITEIAQALKISLGDDQVINLYMSDVVETHLGGREAASFRRVLPDGLTNQFILVELGDSLIACVTVTALPVTLTQQQSTLFAIAESIQFSQP